MHGSSAGLFLQHLKLKPQVCRSSSWAAVLSCVCCCHACLHVCFGRRLWVSLVKMLWSQNSVGFTSVRWLISQHVHNPEWVYSIFPFLPDGDVVRNTGLLCVHTCVRIHTHTYMHTPTPQNIYTVTRKMTIDLWKQVSLVPLLREQVVSHVNSSHIMIKKFLSLICV